MGRTAPYVSFPTTRLTVLRLRGGYRNGYAEFFTLITHPLSLTAHSLLSGLKQSMLIPTLGPLHLLFPPLDEPVPASAELAPSISVPAQIPLLQRGCVPASRHTPKLTLMPKSFLALIFDLLPSTHWGLLKLPHYSCSTSTY